MIGELKARGVSLLYTTHYMEEAERLCDRIAIIDHGKIIADGNQGRARPQDPRLGAGARRSTRTRRSRRPSRRSSKPGGARGRRRRGSCSRSTNPAEEIRRLLETFHARGVAGPRPDLEEPDARAGLPPVDGTGAARMKTILAVAKNRLLNLRHDRAAFDPVVRPAGRLLLGLRGRLRGLGRAATRRIPVALVDEDGSSESRRLTSRRSRPSRASTFSARRRGEGRARRRTRAPRPRRPCARATCRSR